MPGHSKMYYIVFLQNSVAFDLVGTNISHSFMGGQNK